MADGHEQATSFSVLSTVGYETFSNGDHELVDAVWLKFAPDEPMT